MPITSLSGHRWRIVYNLLCRWREFLCELNGNSRTLFAATVNDCNYSRIEIRLYRPTLHLQFTVLTSHVLREVDKLTVYFDVAIHCIRHSASVLSESTKWPKNLLHSPACLRRRNQLVGGSTRAPAVVPGTARSTELAATTNAIS